MGNHLHVAIDILPKTVSDYIGEGFLSSEQLSLRQAKHLIQSGPQSLTFQCRCATSYSSSLFVNSLLKVWELAAEGNNVTEVPFFCKSALKRPQRLLEAITLSQTSCYVVLIVYGACSKCINQLPSEGLVQPLVDDLFTKRLIDELCSKMLPQSLNSPEGDMAEDVLDRRLTYAIHILTGKKATLKAQAMTASRAAALHGQFSRVNDKFSDSERSFSSFDRNGSSNVKLDDRFIFLPGSWNKAFHNSTKKKPDAFHNDHQGSETILPSLIRHFIPASMSSTNVDAKSSFRLASFAATEALQNLSTFSKAKGIGIPPETSQLTISSVEKHGGLNARVFQSPVANAMSAPIIISPRTMSAAIAEASPVVAALAISPRGVRSLSCKSLTQFACGYSGASRRPVFLSSKIVKASSKRSAGKELRPMCKKVPISVAESEQDKGQRDACVEAPWLSETNEASNVAKRSRNEPRPPLHASKICGECSFSSSLKNAKALTFLESQSAMPSESSTLFATNQGALASGEVIPKSHTLHQRSLCCKNQVVDLPQSFDVVKSNPLSSIPQPTVVPLALKKERAVPFLQLNAIPPLQRPPHLSFANLAFPHSESQETMSSAGSSRSSKRVTLISSQNSRMESSDPVSHRVATPTRSYKCSTANNLERSFFTSSSNPNRPLLLVKAAPQTYSTDESAESPLPSAKFFPTLRLDGCHSSIHARVRDASNVGEFSSQTPPMSAEDSHSETDHQRFRSQGTQKSSQGTLSTHRTDMSEYDVVVDNNLQSPSLPPNTLSSDAVIIDYCKQFIARSSIESDQSESSDDREENLCKEKLLIKYRNVCSEVVPNGRIFVSGVSVAQNYYLLKRHGITHIINTAGDTCRNYLPKHFYYLTYILQDNRYSNEVIQSILYNALEYVSEILSSDLNARVLIHCREGVSRSATLAVAYLMWKGQVTFSDALQILRSRRPMCNPNTGFTFVLLRFQKNILGDKCSNRGPNSENFIEKEKSRRFVSACPQKSMVTTSQSPFLCSNQIQAAMKQFSSVTSTNDKIVERKLFRLGVHHKEALFMVVLGISLFEPTQQTWMPNLPKEGLDPRFFYILRQNKNIYFWCGSRTVHQDLSEFVFATEYLRHLSIFERCNLTDLNVQIVREGEESSEFWECLWQKDKKNGSNVRQRIGIQKDLNEAYNALVDNEVFNFAEYCRRQHMTVQSLLRKAATVTPDDEVCAASSSLQQAQRPKGEGNSDTNRSVLGGTDSSRRSSLLSMEVQSTGRRQHNCVSSKSDMAVQDFDRPSIIEYPPMSSSHLNSSRRAGTTVRRRFTVTMSPAQDETFSSNSKYNVSNIVSRNESDANLQSVDFVKSVLTSSEPFTVLSPRKGEISFRQSHFEPSQQHSDRSIRTHSDVPTGFSSHVTPRKPPFIKMPTRPPVIPVLEISQALSTKNMKTPPFSMNCSSRSLQNFEKCRQLTPTNTSASVGFDVGEEYQQTPKTTFVLDIGTVLGGNHPATTRVSESGGADFVSARSQLAIQHTQAEQQSSFGHSTTSHHEKSLPKMTNIVEVNAIIKTGIRSVKVREGDVYLEPNIPYLYEWPHFNSPMDVFDEEDLHPGGYFVVVQYGPKPLLEMLGKTQTFDITRELDATIYKNDNNSEQLSNAAAAAMMNRSANGISFSSRRSDNLHGIEKEKLVYSQSMPTFIRSYHPDSSIEPPVFSKQPPMASSYGIPISQSKEVVVKNVVPLLNGQLSETKRPDSHQSIGRPIVFQESQNPLSPVRRMTQMPAFQQVEFVDERLGLINEDHCNLEDDDTFVSPARLTLVPIEDKFNEHSGPHSLIRAIEIPVNSPTTLKFQFGAASVSSMSHLETARSRKSYEHTWRQQLINNNEYHRLHSKEGVLTTTPPSISEVEIETIRKRRSVAICP